MNPNLKALALPFLLVLTPQAEAFDLNRVLHGKYAFAYSRVCSQSPNGFGPTGVAVPPATELTSAIEMVQTFNGDGTSSATGHALNIINVGTNQNELDFSCTGTYQVDIDGSFLEELSCSGTVVAGPITGQTFTQPGIHRSGRIGILAQTLVLSNTSSSLESITFSGGGIPLARTCGRSGTAVKIF